MASSINKVTLVGRVGKDPKVNALNNGDKVANFTLATSESWKDKNTGERKEKTEWHNIVIFNDNIAGIAEKYVRKGSLVGIDGKMTTRKYTDQAGVDRYIAEVVIDRFRGELFLLGSKDDANNGDGGGERRPAQGNGGGQRRPASKPAQDDMGPDDDIPF